MFYWNRDGISVSAVLDKRKKDKRGLYPIHIRVIYRRVIKDYGIGKKSSPADWEKMMTSKSQSLVVLRHNIKERFNTIVHITEDLANRQEFSFDTLKANYKRVTSPSLKVDDKV